MRVQDIKAMEPLAEVYELKAGVRYIIVVPPDARGSPRDLLRAFPPGWMDGLLIVADKLKFYEIT